MSDDVLESLLSVEQLLPESNEQTEAGDNTNVSDAVEISVDHVSYVTERSDARLVYYIAGYVARKRILCLNCEQCKAACLVSKENVPPSLPADACLQWDLGGLVYPSHALYNLIQSLENKLTHFFSTARLHAESVADIWRKIGQVSQVGCSEHAFTLTQSVVRFYCLTRVHFFLKGVNQKEDEKKAKRVKPCVL